MNRARRLSLVMLASLSFLAAGAGCAPDEEPPNFPEERSRLESETGVKWAVLKAPGSVEPRFAAPLQPISLGIEPLERQARELFLHYAAELHGTGRGDELADAETIVQDGFTTIRFAQRLPGTTVPIDGAASTATFDEEGRLVATQPSFFSSLETIDERTGIDSNTAIRLAQASLPAACGIARAEGEALLVVDVVYGPPRLAYSVQVWGSDCGSRSVRVDAKSGEVYASTAPERFLAKATVKGVRNHLWGEQSDVKTVDYEASDGKLAIGGTGFNILRESIEEGRLTVARVLADTPEEWDSTVPNNGGRGAAVDAAFALDRAVAFFSDPKFANNGFIGGKNRPSIVVHDTHKGENSEPLYGAYFVPSGSAGYSITNVIYVPDGPLAANAGRKASYAAGLDLVGHEVGHGIVANTSKLTGTFDSLVVDEAFADIIGATVERYVTHPDRRSQWSMGEAISHDRSPIRDLRTPSSVTGAHGADFVGDPNGNAKDPHAIAGIGTRAFAFMVEGGTDGNRGVNMRGGLGWDASMDVWYATVTTQPPLTSLLLVAGQQIFRASSRLRKAPVAGAGLDTSDPAYAPVHVIACAWQAVGYSYFSQLYGIDCNPTIESTSPLPRFASCSGTQGRAYVCNDAAPYSAYICENGVIAGSISCSAPGTSCVHPSETDFTASVTEGRLSCR